MLVGRFAHADLRLAARNEPQARDQLLFLGLAGVVAYQMLQEDDGKQWYSSVVLEDLKLIETASGRVMWSGRAPGLVITRGRAYPGHGLPDTFLWVDLALKDAVTRLADALRTSPLR